MKESKCAICGHPKSQHGKLQCLTDEQGVMYWQFGGCWECPCPEYQSAEFPLEPTRVRAEDGDQ